MSENGSVAVMSDRTVEDGRAAGAVVAAMRSPSVDVSSPEAVLAAARGLRVRRFIAAGGQGAAIEASELPSAEQKKAGPKAALKGFAAEWQVVCEVGDADLAGEWTRALYAEIEDRDPAPPQLWSWFEEAQGRWAELVEG